MNKQKLLQALTTTLGFAAMFLFAANLHIFEVLRPVMTSFAPLTSTHESLLPIIGASYVCMTLYLVIMFFRIMNVMRKDDTGLSIKNIFLLSTILISLLFIFGDFTLLSDIGNQYEAGLDQPEWTFLYAANTAQMLLVFVLLFNKTFRVTEQKDAPLVSRDHTVFIIVQYIGVVIGLLGVLQIVLNYYFPTPLWMMKLHLVSTMVFLCVPYLLAVLYWVMVKLREKPRVWLDEKQQHDLGVSALVTILCTISITGLTYAISFDNLQGILSVQWFPFMIYVMLTIFSALNLYQSRD